MKDEVLRDATKKTLESFRSAFAIDCSMGGRTKQSFRDQVDVNSIVARARAVGFLPDSGREPMFADVSAVPDYQASLHIVMQAEESFAALGAKVRERFANDPAVMVAFLSDPSNKDEAIKLGLFKAPEPAPVIPEGTKPDGAPQAAV